MIAELPGLPIRFDSCFLVQKIQALAFWLHRLKGDGVGFALTWEQHKQLEIVMQHQFGEAFKPKMLRDVLQFRLAKPSLPDFLETVDFDDRVIMEGIWNTIPLDFFDPGQQCERILDELETIRPDEALFALLFCRWDERLNRLERLTENFPIGKTTMQQIKGAVLEINRTFENLPDISSCDMIMHWIDDLECQAARVNQLLTEFHGCSEFVANLHRDGVALATTEAEKTAIIKALRRSAGAFRQVDQVILTGEVQTPTGIVLQRLFVSQSEEQRLIASATTEQFA
jgi:hypothetical protein